MSLAARFPGIEKLSVEDRLALIEELWEGIREDEPPLQLSEAERKELERRAAEDDAAPGNSIHWEVIKAEARARRLSPA